MIKDTIATALKTKYKGFGLSTEAIDRIASAKEKTVTNEEDVETAIADADTMTLIAGELQKMRDQEIQKRTDTQRAFDTYKENHPDKGSKSTKEDDDDSVPEWAKSIIARLDKRDADEKQGKTLANIRTRLEGDGCTNKGILNMALKGFTLGENESEDAAVERLKAEYNQSFKDTFGTAPVPGAGGGGHVDDDKAFHKSLSDYAESKGLGKKE